MGHAPDEPMRCMVGPIAATFPAQSSAFSKLSDCGNPDWGLLCKRSFPGCPGKLGRDFLAGEGRYEWRSGAWRPGRRRWRPPPWQREGRRA